MHTGAALQGCGVESGSGARFLDLASDSVAAPTLLAAPSSCTSAGDSARATEAASPESTPRRSDCPAWRSQQLGLGPTIRSQRCPLAGSQAAQGGAPGCHREPGPQGELVAMSSLPWTSAQPSDGLEPCSRLQGGRQDSRSSCESSNGNSLLCPMSPRWTVPAPPSHR